jgi:small subunit ribosomal protein S4e
VLRLPRKQAVWTVKPAPGPHPADESIPLRLVARDYLGLTRTAREADRILAQGNILVDGRVRRDPKFVVGLMDVVQVPKTNKNYRVLLNTRGRLVLHEIPPNEASFKLCKVIRKVQIPKKRIQLGFHDGKTLAGEYGEFCLSDVAKLSLPDFTVIERFAFGSGMLALITGGKSVGKVGKITEIKRVERAPDLVTLKALDGATFQAPKEYVFVVGKEKPLIPLQGFE